MSSFAKTILTSINKFRNSPESISKQISTFKIGLSRLKKKDPFLKEIDTFLSTLSNLPKMKDLTLNKDLTKSAEKEMKVYLEDENYPTIQEGNELQGKIPNTFLQSEPAMIFNEGADDAESVLIQTLLNKTDTNKVGRAVLTDPEYTQVGICHENVNEINFIVLIFTKGESDNKAASTLKAGAVKKVAVNNGENAYDNEDLTELKQAFDLFDKDGSQTIKIDDAIQAMKRMKFDQTNPVLFGILNELAQEDVVSWDTFSNHVQNRMTDRVETDGLKTIFDLFIDDPKHETITFETFKRICKEIGEELTEDELKHILSNTVDNGDEMTFGEFCQYLRGD
jgi:Ca2+-binding EF-hand superfamily protein